MPPGATLFIEIHVVTKLHASALANRVHRVTASLRRRSSTATSKSQHASQTPVLTCSRSPAGVCVHGSRHARQRVLSKTFGNLENTVDYCIHGRLLRHAAAHSSACKQNKSRSGIIAARESISSLTLYCSSSPNLENTVDYCIHGGHEHSSQTWISELRAATPHNYSSTTLYYKVLFQYYSVLQSTTPVLLCTTKYYSSTTLYYTVLLKYYSVLHSATPVLLCTTKYYSSTTLYYKVLFQYYSVLHSTTLYYTVLLQYYSVLPSTTPVLLCTTKYYSVLQSTTPVLVS